MTKGSRADLGQVVTLTFRNPQLTSFLKGRFLGFLDVLQMSHFYAVSLIQKVPLFEMKLLFRVLYLDIALPNFVLVLLVGKSLDKMSHYHSQNGEATAMAK